MRDWGLGSGRESVELAVEVDGADAGEGDGALERALEADGWSRLVVRARR